MLTVAQITNCSIPEKDIGPTETGYIRDINHRYVDILKCFEELQTLAEEKEPEELAFETSFLN